MRECFYCLSVTEIYEMIKIYEKKRNRDVR